MATGGGYFEGGRGSAMSMDAWQRFPIDVFFCQASLGYLPEGPDESESLLQAVSRSISTPKGQSGIHIVGEAFLESAHSVVQGGGTWREMATARAAGVARAVITFPV